MDRLQFNFALEGALNSAKSKNNKALKALLDMNSIKYQEGKFEGLQEQIEALQKDASYLFDLETTPQNTGGLGSFGRNNQIENSGSSQSAFMDAIRNNSLRK